MSNLFANKQATKAIDNPCAAIERIISPTEKVLGDLTVRHLLPFTNKQMVGPWIFFDHAGPVVFERGKGLDVRPHPHIGLATVTYLFAGEVLHRDSLGNTQIITPGDINLMVAGRGIVHSERTPLPLKKTAHTLHALQLWLALPTEQEDIEPAFFHYPAKVLPTITVENVPIRVMLGSAYGITSPIKTATQTLYAEAHLQPGQSITVPQVTERAVYVVKGQLKDASGTPIRKHHMAVFSQQESIVLHAEEETQIAIIGGAPLGERFIEWNFVASTKARIERAKQDWKQQQFATIAGDDAEFIPLPDCNHPLK